MGIVAKKDVELLLKFKRNIEAILQEQNKLKNQVRTYIATDRSLKAEKLALDEQKENQVYLLSNVEKDRDLHLMALKEWRDAGVQLEERLKSFGKRDPTDEDVTQVSFFEKQGQLKVPVNRDIIQKYGIFTDTRFDTKIFHKGLFFAAKPGDPISALDRGKVVHSGWVNGFGETIILDHGDHYYSVYAHCSELSKKLGQNVNSGEIIGKSGDTGSLRGPGLYFEIRHFSESLDPLPWLDLKPLARL